MVKIRQGHVPTTIDEATLIAHNLHNGRMQMYNGVFIKYDEWREEYQAIGESGLPFHSEDCIVKLFNWINELINWMNEG